MFGKRFRLFKLLGFQVQLDVSWLIIAVLVTWTLAVGVFPQRFQGLTPATYWIMGVVGACGLFASIAQRNVSRRDARQRSRSFALGINR